MSEDRKPTKPQPRWRRRKARRAVRRAQEQARIHAATKHLPLSRGLRAKLRRQSQSED